MESGINYEVKGDILIADGKVVGQVLAYEDSTGTLRFKRIKKRLHFFWYWMWSWPRIQFFKREEGEWWGMLRCGLAGVNLYWEFPRLARHIHINENPGIWTDKSYNIS